MKTWEFDLELRVRKTLTPSGPTTEEASRSIAVMALSGGMNPSHFIKWSDGRTDDYACDGGCDWAETDLCGAFASSGHSIEQCRNASDRAADA